MKRLSKLSAYYELTKPRIMTMVLVTTALGFYLASEGKAPTGLFAYLLLGVAMVCGGSSVLNHYLEREFDSKMERTKNRPIPSGIIAPERALSFGIVLALAGIFILYVKVNILTAFLSLLTSFLYIMVYTPMKRFSWLNTTVGAFPGAIPPLGGWAAATGSLSFEAGILFLILFIWQHPHFYAIAWMMREDYRRGGFKMLPVVEPTGERMFRHITWWSYILIPVSLIPVVIGMSGAIYCTGALAAGILLLMTSRRFVLTRSNMLARRLLPATVVYLPVLLFLIVIDLNF
ncbi:MAG: protoheme IX farnesyltransferase [Omnitrophica WOR_2 bacterium RIFCSPHIGHO2_02_FULL_52_10]|nr:MAG: protoheme IX farnesyltransferase [Omnitrophica WOR_2 bacterium RIFCSPHIGHO2_02_FULL_52_10]